MKGHAFSNSIILTLLIGIILLLSSQAVLAVKPGTEPPTPPSPVIIIDSVVVDYTNSKIVVTGEGFNEVTEVILGGDSILADINDSTATNTLLEFDFSSNMISAVPTTPGNYSLELNGNAFSVYFSTAVVFSTSTACPCQTEWESFAATSPSAGFSGVPATCLVNSTDYVHVEFWDFTNNNMWILETEYTTNIKKCALVFDGATHVLTQEQHNACSNYLNTFTAPPDNTYCLF